MRWARFVWRAFPTAMAYGVKVDIDKLEEARQHLGESWSERRGRGFKPRQWRVEIGRAEERWGELMLLSRSLIVMGAGMQGAGRGTHSYVLGGAG